jgi:glycogen debranching enzyme
MNDQVTSEAALARPPGGSDADTSGPARRYLNDLVSAVYAPAMCLSGPDGQIRPGGPQGLYVRDLRALSEVIVTVDGTEPVPLGYDLLGGASNGFSAALLNPVTKGADPQIFLVRQRSLGPDGMQEQFVFTSYSPTPGLGCRVELRLQCDLAGIGVVNAGVVNPGLPATELPPSKGAAGLAWQAGSGARVVVTGTPAPDRVDPPAGTMNWDIALKRGQPVNLSVTVSLEAPDPPLFTTPSLPPPLEAPLVVARDQRLAQFLQVSLADLRALAMTVSGTTGQTFLAAGVPWYLTLFGRDSIWAARMLLPLGTDLALGTLRALASRQGKETNARTGEEPGKILHEVRHESPPAPSGDGLHWLPPVYYGTVDATALWVCLLHETWKWGAPEEEVERLLPTLQGCLAWIGRAVDRGGGFVSYVDESGQGLSNQGWKDSFDGVQFRDGRFARPPLALCEVQGYTYQAAVAGAELAVHFGLGGSEQWLELAGGLAERFRERFWVSDDGGAFPALALEADGTPVDAPSSNMGHLLGTGMLNPAECELVAKRLGSPEMDCGYGLRTLSSRCRGFNPLSYHVGSVWAHDTAIAISGLALSGGPAAQATAASLIDGLLGAADGFAYRLPELYGGHRREPLARAPLPYPPACRPQAWSAASSVAVLTALMGWRPDMPSRQLHVSPLPSAVGLHRVEGVMLGGVPVRAIFSPDGPGVEGGPAGLVLNLVRKALA